MNGKTITVLRFFVFIIVVLSLYVSGQEQADDGPLVTVSGNNEINGSHGTITYDPHKPIEGIGNYLTDYLDFDIGIKNFFVKGTFLVNSPSIGYNPLPEVFNEFFHRRTIGFKSKYLNVEAGNFKTTFGKGLTLNLRESRKTEKNYVLDGACLTSELPWLSFQALAGRSPENKLKKVVIAGDIDTTSTWVENINYRDNIMGAYVQSYYPFSTVPALSFMSASSFGGGIVYFGNKIRLRDTVDITDSLGNTIKEVPYQERNEAYLPSWFINFSFGNIDVSYENALMYYNAHTIEEVYDTIGQLVDAKEITKNYYSYSGYVSVGAGVGDFYFSGEYKNYFYLRKGNPGFGVVDRWVEPPDARQKHGWHLLTKHTLLRSMSDDLGYNGTLTWSGGNATLKTNFSISGRHIMDKDSTRYRFFGFSKEFRNWESYTQWEQTFTNKFNTLFGVSIGVLDPRDFDLLSRTAAAKLMFGPFAEKHSLDLTLEAQYNTKEFNNVTKDTIITQNVFNLFMKPSYSFSPYITVFLAIEKEPELYFNYLAAKEEEKLDINNYFSGGIVFSPVDNHTLTIEAGSMSGRMECNPPPCVYILPFKGIKVTLNSVF